MLRPELRSYFYLHLSVLLWSFTAILGDLIALTATTLVWWRVALTTVIMMCLPVVWKAAKSTTRRQVMTLSGIGVLVAIHWLCFYGAIKLANASVSLITMATTTLFTAFLEPLIRRESVSRLDILFGVLIIPCIYLTTTGIERGMILGFWVGILGAFLAALFAVFNRIWSQNTSPSLITTIEMGSAWIFLSIILGIWLLMGDMPQFVPSTIDTIYLLILAVGCTVIPYILHLKAFEHLTAFASNLVINLEPVYGILLAFCFLQDHEELGIRFYYGVGLIFLVVMIYPSCKRYFELQSQIAISE